MAAWSWRSRTGVHIEDGCIENQEVRTATDDGSVKLAYARRPVSTPRVFSFIATTNKDRPLPYDMTLCRETSDLSPGEARHLLDEALDEALAGPRQAVVVLEADQVSTMKR